MADSLIQQDARMKQHRITPTDEIPTIPISENHLDGSWLDTDVYLGELCLNMTDDRAWFRSNNGIIEFNTASPLNGLWVRDADNIRSIHRTGPFGAPQILPPTGDSGSSDLGYTSDRWRDLYLKGNPAGSIEANINFTYGLHLREETQGPLITLNVGHLTFSTDNSEDVRDNGYGNAETWLDLNTADANLAAYTGISRLTAGITAPNIYTAQIRCSDSGSDPDLSGAAAENYLEVNSIGSYVYLKDVDQRFRGITQQAALECDEHKGQVTVETSDATLTIIKTIALATSGSMVTMEGRLNGTDGASEICGAKFFAVFKNVSGTVTQIGSTTLDVKSSTAQTMDVSISGTNIRIRVQGKVATTMAWVLTYKFNRLNYDFGV